MRTILFVCLVVTATATAAHAQFPMGPGMPAPPPVVVPRPPAPVMPGPQFYAPRYYPPPPAYAPAYAQPVNLYYWRKAHIFRAIGIPLLSVGIPMSVAGGIVWIVGAACNHCSSNVTNTGIGLFAGGAALFIPGAILLGLGNYYHWMARVTARANFGLAFARDHGGATVRIRF